MSNSSLNIHDVESVTVKHRRVKNNLRCHAHNTITITVKDSDGGKFNITLFSGKMDVGFEVEK